MFKIHIMFILQRWSWEKIRWSWRWYDMRRWSTPNYHRTYAGRNLRVRWWTNERRVWRGGTLDAIREVLHVPPATPTSSHSAPTLPSSSVHPLWAPRNKCPSSVRQTAPIGIGVWVSLQLCFGGGKRRRLPSGRPLRQRFRTTCPCPWSDGRTVAWHPGMGVLLTNFC